MKLVMNFLRRSVGGIFCAVMVWLGAITMMYSVPKFGIIFLISLASLCLCVLFLYRKCLPLLENISEKRLHIIMCALMTLAFLAMLKAAYSLRVDVFETWDYGQLIRTAYGIVRNGGSIDVPTYYARYPNNSMFLLLLSGYFECVSGICGDNIYSYITATLPLNCILLVLSCFFTYLAVCKWSGHVQGFITGLFMLALLPLYVYAAIAYTDVFGIFPVALTLYFYACAKTAQGNLCKYMMLCLAAVTVVFGYLIKASIIIAVIAIFIDLLLGVRYTREKLLCTALYLFVCCLCFGAGDRVTNQFLVKHGVSEQMMWEEEFPVTHWIMMSLNLNAKGGYVTDDVGLTRDCVGKEAKQKANLEQISDRIQIRGIAGTLHHLFVTKATRMWADGTYSSADYISRKPLVQGSFRDFFARNGKYNSWYSLITQLYHMLLLIMGICFGIRNMLEKNNASLVSELILIGVFLFYLLWECNSRYVIVFLPILVEIAVNSMDMGNSKASEKEICGLHV